MRLSAWAITCFLASVAAAPANTTLLGFAVVSASEKGQRVAIARIDPATGHVHYSPALFDLPSDAFCNVAWDGQHYFQPSATRAVDPAGNTLQAILTLDRDGTLLHNATMSAAYGLPAIAWAPGADGGALLAVGTAPGISFALLLIDPQTGVTDLLAEVAFEGVALCEAAFAPRSAAAPDGALVFLASTPAVDEQLVAFDIHTKSIVSRANFSEGLNAITLWEGAPGSAPFATPHILAFSFSVGRPFELLDVEVASGKSVVLAALPDESFQDFQGALAWDAPLGVAWTVATQQAANGTLSTVLVAFNLTEAPPTVRVVALNETHAKGGIWALDVWVRA